MKLKKLFVLSVLMFAATMLFTGCGTKSLTEEYETAKEIAYNFLNTKGYEVPKEYTVSFEGQNREKLIVKCNNNSTKVTFNVTSSNNCELSSLYYLVECQITQEDIKTANKLIDGFLNTKGFTIPRHSYNTYEINYRKDTDLVDVKLSDIHELNSIIITYDISYKEPQIAELTYYKSIWKSRQWIALVIIIALVFMALIFVLYVIFDHFSS